MARLTITLSDERHRRLRARSAIEGKSIGQLIEEELDASEQLTRERVTRVLEAAWRHADDVRPDATDEDVMQFALDVERGLIREAVSGQRSERT